MMITSLRNVMNRRHPRTGEQPRTDAGYAMVAVMGMGGVIVLGATLVGGYALQGMRSAGHAQGFHAAIQVAQAGADDALARIRAAGGDLSAAVFPSDFTPVPGSVDGSSPPQPCAGRTANDAGNCPMFKYTVVQNGDNLTITSIGRSRGQERSVRITARKRALTDYLYFSQSENRDPNAGILSNIPGGALGWRDGDSTEGSRLHTVETSFQASGTPEFDSRISSASSACANNIAACLTGGSPEYKQGSPGYATDLAMPDATTLTSIQNPAALDAGGCTYHGPTRIKLMGNQMQVWSPQTPYTVECGGGLPANLLSATANVTVTDDNLSLLDSLLGILPCIKAFGVKVSGRCPGDVVSVPVSGLVANVGLLAGLDLGQLNGIRSSGHVVNLPTSGALYVQDNAFGNSPILDPNAIQCLLNSALGMYTTLDTNITAGLLNATNQPQANCRAGKLFIDGTLDGKVTMGADDDILIMDNLTYRTSDNADDDRLGLVAKKSVEVYNPLQCTLAASTCLSVRPLGATLLSTLGGVRSAVGGNLSAVLQQVPGYNEDRTVEAAIIALEGHFGMQLPVASASLATSVLNGLLSLRIDPPSLTVVGSIAQKHRGVTAADLLSLAASGLGIDLASANVDVGFDANYVYDRSFVNDPPGHLPAAAGDPAYEQLTFAEL